jgi:hypothetical protein
MQPVWVLSVDLQTKTASFTSGLGDAARSARGAFSEIKGGAGEAGKEVGYSMMEARHGVMFLAEEFGVHIPGALAGFVASIGPIGAAMEAAFPFLTIVVGATMLIEHLVKMHEVGEKLTEDQAKFAIAVQSAFNALDEKLLQAQIRADELNNDHLGALKKSLELIDRQSMDDLIKQFDDLAKASDAVFEGLKVSWYQLGIGSAGAKHALTEFQLEYKKLLAEGKGEEAGGLLTGTLDQARKTLDMMHQLASSRSGDGQTGDYEKYKQAADYLREKNLLTNLTADTTKTELQSQEALVATLEAQAAAQARVEDIKNQQGKNAKTSAANEASAREASAAKESAESLARIREQQLTGDKSVADAQLTIKHASIEARLASDVDFANREMNLQLAANKAQIAALDKSGKDYANQLKALKDKQLEIEQLHSTTVTQLRSKAAIDANARDLAALEQGIREQIAATQQGSAERIAAIDAGIRMEEARNLQETDFYKQLATQRVQAVRQSAEEEARIRQEMGRIEADYELQNGELILAAQQQALALSESLTTVSMQRRIADETRLADLEFELKQEAIRKEIQALDIGAKDYQARLRELQNKEKLLVQQHENDITGIKVRAELERNQRVMQAESQFEDTIARGLTQSIMGHQTWAQTLMSIGDQVVSAMIENAIKSMLADDMTKEKDAAYAARQAFKAGMHFPFPANLVMAPVLAAGAFAAVMAFQSGTDMVPGTGKGDRVPAMLEPGEGVVPGGVMDGLRSVAKNGGFQQGQAIHVHATYAPKIQAFDSTGVDEVLDKHGDKFGKHIEKHIRRLNK